MEQTLSSTSAAPIMAKAKISPTMVLIKNAWQIYKERFWSFVGIGLVPLLVIMPFAVVFYGVSYIQSPAFNNILALLRIIFIVSLIYMFMATDAGFILMLKDPVLKIGGAFKAGRRYAWLLGIIELAAYFLIMLWSILFIIPGIIFAVYYSLAAFFLLFEDKKDKTALKRSKELVKGYWWPVAGRYLVIFLVEFVGIGIFALLPNGNVDNMGLAQLIVEATIINIFLFTIKQFFTIYSYLIFKDLQQIKAQQ